MNIHYDSQSGQWYQTSLDTAVIIGGMNEILPRKTKNEEDFSFDLNTKDGKVGPLIGILTARKTDGTISGNSSLFIQLQKKLLALKGFSFIFTADGVNGSSVNGYAYLPEEHSWKKMTFPYPDLVYNRIPFRKSEKEKNVRTILADLKAKNIPFFNPCFLDKYQIYQLFKNHSVLQNFLPETDLITGDGELLAFLQKHTSVYVKPAQAAKGKGIFRLRLENSSELSFEGLLKQKQYESFAAFWQEQGANLTVKPYLVQEEIFPARYKGKRFDFRILAHADLNDYRVTGVGIRQSQGQELTTHIPNGGRLLPYHLFQTAELDQFIQLVVSHVGRTLTNELGYFGEFSIDAGISKEGKNYLYEVNSKPMRFDEEEIEERRITQLCRLFFQLTGFD